jgi:lipoprotein-anchoring transpeptidase ErfK/SrfK
MLGFATAVTSQPRKPAPPPPAPKAAATGVTPFDVQVLLDRAGFSPGEIDGRTGRNTRMALRAFQEARKLQPTGQADKATLEALGWQPGKTVHRYTIAPEDVVGPFVKEIPEDMMERSKLPSLGFTSALEALGEKFHTAPALLQKLNPGARFAAGEQIIAPAVTAPPDKTRAAPGDFTIVVTRATSALQVLRADRQVIYHAPVTTGSEHDPLPVGTWKVTGVSRNPTFNYNPDLFWDADPAHAKAKIPPGPNNPVGVVWIDLSRQHYGLHGTPEPGRIGYTESHGCVRMTNWDALTVAGMARPGTVVIFQ